MSSNDPKRVLQIVSSMDRGGAETLLMNIYRNIDRTKIQFDFVSHSNTKDDFYDEITSLGGKVYKVNSLGRQGPMNYLKELIKIMRSTKYTAIHSHTDFQSGFPALAAKMCGIKKRISHSHSNDWQKGERFRDQLTLKILKLLIKLSATDYCSCSTEAAEFLFGKKMVRRYKVNILKNGIDLNQFHGMDSCIRDHVIEELNLSKQTKIIGHVGRFSYSKNHFFILKVLIKLLDNDPSFVVLLIGDGPLKESIEEEAKALGVLENIRFLGVRTDIPRLMKAFDVFLFPSLFEGFGIALLEAQCSGTPCVVSDSVPKTTDMGLGLMSCVSLEGDLKAWTDQIVKAITITRPEPNTIFNNLRTRGFSIQENVPKWMLLYLGNSRNFPSTTM
ncbi:glycosyltransferase family 1 protein [Heyndrickxia sp. NPDC080065]|uniref:glycosyltransferase family 1 protein n=1 Tax=Heyndrickxia sp. NPDC080065 TaxID=3390568 RepID=UPI003D0499CE